MSTRRLPSIACAFVLALACGPKGTNTPDDGGKTGRRDGKGKGGSKKGGDDLPPGVGEHLEQCLGMEVDSEVMASSISEAPMLQCQALMPLSPEVEHHLQSRCDGGEAPACHVLGDALRGERIVKFIAEIVRTTCGPTTECDMLRRQYSVSAFGTPRPDAGDRSAALLAKGCELGRADSCLARGVIEKDLADSADWMGRACALGRAAGCAQRLHHEIFFGESTIDPTAVKLTHELCEKGHASACATYGALVSRGTGGAKPSPTEALQHYTTACDDGSPGGCASMVFFAMNHKVDDAKRDAAAAKLGAICKDGDVGPACAAAGVALQRGWGTKADKAAAKTWLKKNCDAGVDAACYAIKKK